MCEQPIEHKFFLGQRWISGGPTVGVGDKYSGNLISPLWLAWVQKLDEMLHAAASAD